MATANSGDCQRQKTLFAQWQLMNFEDNIKKYIQSRSSCILLVASESVMSKSVRTLCSSGIGERYCVSPEAPWKYPREALLEDVLTEVRQFSVCHFLRTALGICTLASMSWPANRAA